MELQIQDIQVAAQIIDLAVQRGAFRANEVTPEDMQNISKFRKIINNYINMSSVLNAITVPVFSILLRMMKSIRLRYK